MKRNEIERIIKQGSMKQKIKLYFTDLAYFNTVGINSSSFVDAGDTTKLETPDKILTAKEKDIIYQSIKEPKDIKYYGDLRIWNKAFLMFKPNISLFTKDLSYLTAQISEKTGIALMCIAMEETINDLLEEVEVDKKLREKLVKKALESLEEKSIRAERYQEEGYLPFIQISEDNMRDAVLDLVEILNKKIKVAKEYIKTLEAFLNKNLPLQPYRDFLRKEEESIKANIGECRRFIDVYFLGIAIKDNVENLERFKILTWEEVEVEVVDEDIEDIKSAGI
jgi:hypothetical protein